MKRTLAACVSLIYHSNVAMIHLSKELFFSVHSMNFVAANKKKKKATWKKTNCRLTGIFLRYWN